MKFVLFEFYDPETDETFYYLIETGEKDREKLREIRDEIQDEYDKIYSDFEDYEEVYEWLGKKIKEYIPDARHIDFVFVG